MTEALAVATDRITKTFGRTRAIDELNLRVSSACVYGFLGPNGAGKTTTIRILLGLIRPDQGDMSLFGLSPRDHRKEILRKIGTLVEEPAIYPRLTGRENLRVLTRLVDIPPNRVEEALRQVELLDAADKLVGHYSQGMKQRLGLAMALLNEPQLLILDEPTNGLDPGGIRSIRELLVRLAKQFGISVFVSSHLLSEMEKIADHLGVIHQGKLMFQGTLKELQQARDGYVYINTRDPEAALAILKNERVACRFAKEETVMVDASEPEIIARLNRLLVQAGLQVYGITEHTHKLEDLFLELTAKEHP
jgi:lantibiotic transport system ATP-binding protein